MGYPEQEGPRVRAAGARWDRFRRLVFATYGDTCWICGHGGARQVDHVESITEHPELVYALSNCRPAHGSPRNPCPVCSVAAGRKIHCNQLKAGMGVERARRIINGRTGNVIPPARPESPRDDPGRDW